MDGIVEVAEQRSGCERALWLSALSTSVSVNRIICAAASRTYSLVYSNTVLIIRISIFFQYVEHGNVFSVKTEIVDAVHNLAL